MRNLTPYNLTQYDLRDQVELYVSMPSLFVMCYYGGTIYLAGI